MKNLTVTLYIIDNLKNNEFHLTSDVRKRLSTKVTNTVKTPKG